MPGLGHTNVTKPTFASECCSVTSKRGDYQGNGNAIAGQVNASDGREFMVGTMVWTLSDCE